MDITKEDQQRLLRLARQALEARVRRRAAAAGRARRRARLAVRCVRHDSLPRRTCEDVSAASTSMRRSPTRSRTSRRRLRLRSAVQPRVPARARRHLARNLGADARSARSTSIDEIEIGRHGLIVEQGHRRGLLLPQVATEHGWDRETFLDHTCLKASLPPTPGARRAHPDLRSAGVW